MKTALAKFSVSKLTTGLSEFASHCGVAFDSSLNSRLLLEIMHRSLTFSAPKTVCLAACSIKLLFPTSPTPFALQKTARWVGKIK